MKYLLFLLLYFVTGGEQNTIYGDRGTISGGESNIIDQDTTPSAYNYCHNFIGGGKNNLICSFQSGIASGTDNIINNYGFPGTPPDGCYNFIGGGRTNC